MRRSLVKNAALSAREIVVSAIAGSISILLACFLIVVSLQSAYRTAAEQARRAGDAAGVVLLASERASAVVRMAAATGSRDWIDRFDEHAATLADAMSNARMLAPPIAVERFDREARAASDRLREIERRAIEWVRAGDLKQAMALIESTDYGVESLRLEVAISQVAAAIRDATARQLAQIESGRTILLLSLMAVALIGFLILWRRLMALLGRWEQVFAAQETTIHDLAVNDTLTGLPNRRAFTDVLGTEVAHAVRSGSDLAVLLIDLDRFKPVNDQHGHGVGDRVLVEIGRRLRRVLRRTETAARLGGDEFVVIVPIGSNGDAPAIVAQRIIDELSRPMVIDGHTVEIGASIGHATCPADGTDPTELLRRADVALYRAKADGRGVARSFDATMDAELRERLALEGEIRRAIAAEQIVPYFQPLVRLATSRVIGFEILARWQHPDRGIISPAKFVPVAERLGLVSDMTLSVLRKACEAARDWPQDIKLAMNVAPMQLKDPMLPQRLLAVLTETGFAPRRLEIEITENALVDDIEMAKDILLSLRNLGIGIALDDFGTGYASLSQLSELAVDKIKIDRSFIQTMQEKPASLTIVHAIVGLGGSLGLPTLAEGIESQEVADALAAIGCTDGQGYLYSRPIPAVDVPQLLKREALRQKAAA